MWSGRPAIGVDLLLTDAAGVPLPEQRGVEGRLRVRGAAVVARYFGQAASALDDDGWFVTGDLAQIEANGELAITGRAKDLIKSGGEWINPAEIEAIVGALPQVAQAAVIGRADVKWGERPLLLVELSDVSASDDKLLSALKGRRRGGCPTRSCACRGCRSPQRARSTNSLAGRSWRRLTGPRRAPRRQRGSP
ncbi:AMP-binding enzyme [Sphingomonas sp. MMS24-JH45]